MFTSKIKRFPMHRKIHTKLGRCCEIPKIELAIERKSIEIGCQLARKKMDLENALDTRFMMGVELKGNNTVNNSVASHLI
jgi:hypothetical protein